MPLEGVPTSEKIKSSQDQEHRTKLPATPVNRHPVKTKILCENKKILKVFK